MGVQIKLFTRHFLRNYCHMIGEKKHSSFEVYPLQQKPDKAVFLDRLKINTNIKMNNN